jgi:hypothetical protein
MYPISASQIAELLSLARNAKQVCLQMGLSHEETEMILPYVLEALLLQISAPIETEDVERVAWEIVTTRNLERAISKAKWPPRIYLQCQQHLHNMSNASSFRGKSQQPISVNDWLYFGDSLVKHQEQKQKNLALFADHEV